MKHKGFFWLTFTAITLLCCIDYQFFTEGMAWHYTPFQRQVGHIILLALITPIGYLGWRKHPVQWFSYAWLLAYGFALAFIGTIGLIQWKLQPFPTEFLDYVSGIRLFFTSPVPYFMLYILSVVAARNSKA